MKISIITMRPFIADKKKNLGVMRNYILNNDADFYIFGEMSLTGYSCKDELRDLAEPVDGPSISTLKKVAKDKGIYRKSGGFRFDIQQ